MSIYHIIDLCALDKLPIRRAGWSPGVDDRQPAGRDVVQNGAE